MPSRLRFDAPIFWLAPFLLLAAVAVAALVTTDRRITTAVVIVGSLLIAMFILREVFRGMMVARRAFNCPHCGGPLKGEYPPPAERVGRDRIFPRPVFRCESCGTHRRWEELQTVPDREPRE